VIYNVRVSRSWIVASLAVIACSKRAPEPSLDLELIVVGQPIQRTDTVGEGRFTDTATFVLVDAENTAGQGANVTLAGDLVDAGGQVVGTLNPQSLWIPAHESRMFALVDAQRQARPTSTAVNIKVRGASIPKQPPIARIEDLHSFDDHGKTVVQAYLVNDADRIGQVMVVGAFHDAAGRPMTRPFRVVRIGPKHLGSAAGDCPDVGLNQSASGARCVVQFVGPEGSKQGAIFVASVNY
jgi:hypothetical protein